MSDKQNELKLLQRLYSNCKTFKKAVKKYGCEIYDLEAFLDDDEMRLAMSNINDCLNKLESERSEP